MLLFFNKLILDHPKTIGFISHGGMNSIVEATSRGVTLICIPLFAEQKRNSKMVQYRGAGIVVEKFELLQEKLVESIRAIVNNPRYFISSIFSSIF